ncbi:peptidoglycan-binding domain-containing protein [Dyella subtropica]|uniref:peptidoglycan-binding domain-containing protein n=1 Tax=Dyella subtropica TaxID=2992127 RepID=UPI0022505045|nr:peptidoglycan-binding protein [Dyella subtropica]
MSNETFSGGDALEPGTMQYYTHQAMMRNELAGGHGAYQISNAQKAASGPSFGPFQYDIGANQHGRDLLESIATDAKDAQGSRIISDQDLSNIKQHLYKPFRSFSAEDRDVYEQMKPKLDQTLSSSAGIQAINRDYLPVLDAKVKTMNDAVAGIQNDANRNFLQGSPVAKLIVLDTANQYGSTVNDGLKALLNMSKDDPAMPMPGRTSPATIKVEGELGLEDLIRYKLETQYGQSNSGAKDVLRRISNIVEAVGVDEVKANLSAEDRQFLETGLKDYLRDHGRDLNIVENKELKALAQLGGWPVDHHHSQHGGPHSHAMKQGSTGDDVANLQRSLQGLGYTDADGQPLQPDGHFGPSTHAAVQAFQAAHNLKPDGVAGPATLKAMEEQTHSLSKPNTSSYQWQCPARLDDPSHPDNALYLQTRSQVHQLDQQNGRTPDQRSDQLAAALTVSARASGLQRIDQIALSEDANTLWGAQRPPGVRDHFFDQHCKIDTLQGLNMPMEQSGAQWPQAMQQFQKQQEQTQQQQSLQQDQAMQQAGPVMQR